MTLEEQYEILKGNAKQLDDSIIQNKIRKAWEYFRNFKIVSMANIEENIKLPKAVYLSNVKNIHGSNMLCWPLNNKYEIYVDEELYNNNQTIVELQLQHEVLHSLSNYINGINQRFGHTEENNKKYIGINEAVTQMFTEDISGVRLSKKEDYLFYVKNVMRVMKVLFGTEIIANQYFNGELDFENSINILTGYQFEAFAFEINNIYNLHKKEFYYQLDDNEELEKHNKEETIISYVNRLLDKYDENQYLDELKSELDSEFYNQLMKNRFGIVK